MLGTNLLKHSAGSALVKQGETKVLVANTIQIGQPSPELPGHGDIVVGVSNTKGNSIRNASDGIGLLQAWLQRILDEWLPPKLNLLTGRACFRLIVTVMILKDDGNVRDAALFACAAAWNCTKLPQMNDFHDVDGKLWLKDPQQSIVSSSDLDCKTTNNIEDDQKATSNSGTFCRISLTIGVVKTGNDNEAENIKLLLDPTLVEQAQVSGLLSCVISLPSFTVQMDYSGSSPLSAADLGLAFKLAKVRAEELSRLL